MSIISDEINRQVNNEIGTNTVLEGAIIKAQEDSINYNTAYYFDVIKDHSIDIQNQITDNWLEDGSAIQDHIAHNPITISLSGLSGEIVFRSPANFKDDMNSILENFGKQYDDKNMPKINSKFSKQINKLGALSALYPSVSNITQLARNAYGYVEQSVSRYANVLSRFLGKEAKETRLEEIFNRLSTISANGTALVVQTPFKTFQNMHIISLSLKQDEENYVCDISMTLKQCNFFSIGHAKANPNVVAIYNQQASADTQNNGTATTQNTALYDRFGFDKNPSKRIN